MRQSQANSPRPMMETSTNPTTGRHFEIERRKGLSAQTIQPAYRPGKHRDERHAQPRLSAIDRAAGASPASAGSAPPRPPDTTGNSPTGTGETASASQVPHPSGSVHVNRVAVRRAPAPSHKVKRAYLSFRQGHGKSGQSGHRLSQASHWKTPEIKQIVEKREPAGDGPAAVLFATFQFCGRHDGRLPGISGTTGGGHAIAQETRFT